MRRHYILNLKLKATVLKFDDIQIIGFDGGKLYIETDLEFRPSDKNVQEIALKKRLNYGQSDFWQNDNDIRRFMIRSASKENTTMMRWTVKNSVSNSKAAYDL